MRLNSLNSYTKASLKLSSGVFKNKINILKYYFFVFLYIITYPLMITGPIVRLCYYQMVSNVSNGYNDYKIFDTFKSLSDTKNLVKALVSSFVKSAILVAILLVLALLTLPFLGISFVIYINTVDTSYFVIWAIPAIVLAVGYLIYSTFFIVPVEQIIVEYPELAINECLSLSFKANAKKNKLKMFGSYFFEYLLISALVGVVAIFVTLEYSGFDYILIFGMILAFVFILFIPYITLTANCVRRNLRKDAIEAYNYKEIENYSRVILKMSLTNDVKKDKKKPKKKNKEVLEINEIEIEQEFEDVKDNNEDSLSDSKATDVVEDTNTSANEENVSINSNEDEELKANIANDETLETIDSIGDDILSEVSAENVENASNTNVDSDISTNEFKDDETNDVDTLDAKSVDAPLEAEESNEEVVLPDSKKEKAPKKTKAKETEKKASTAKKEKKQKKSNKEALDESKDEHVSINDDQLNTLSEDINETNE